MQIDCTRRALICAGAGALATPTLGWAGAARKIMVLGDSLSAEYGLPRDSGWVALLAQRLRTQAPDWSVVNASISGETSSGGRTRLNALLATHQPKVVVIELGANDALRGLPIKALIDNLSAMTQACQQAGAKVMLVGMQVPPNFGKRYTQDFAASFETVSRAQSAALLPFLLKGVADRPDAKDWFQADGIHPQAKAHPIILDQVWPVLRPLLFGR